jgi:ribosomal protein L28
MAVCMNCGKSNVMGTSQRHGRGVAGKRWKKRAQATPRVFKVNIQAATMVVDGLSKKVKLCTKCIKKMKTKKVTVQKKTVGAPLQIASK